MKQEKPGPRGCAVSRHGEREGGGEGGEGEREAGRGSEACPGQDGWEAPPWR